jgi:hypothetical protein
MNFGGDMPYLNEDGTIDTLKGYIRQCDHCVAIEKVFDEATDKDVGRYDEIYALETTIRELFKGTSWPGVPRVLCVECMTRLMPNLYKIRDAIELDIFVNRLKGAINEKRKQGTKDHRQLRTMLANAAKGVLNGDLDIERATALHKLAKNISESLYSETKIAMFSHEIGSDIPKMGDLPLVGSDA